MPQSLGNEPLPYIVANSALYTPGKFPKGVGAVHTITVEGINGLVAAATPLLVVPQGYRFICMGAFVRVLAVTGAATVGVARIRDVTAGVDLVGNTTLTAADAAGEYIPLPLPTSVNKVVVAASTISVELTTAYTVATVVTLGVDLQGYLI